MRRLLSAGLVMAMAGGSLVAQSAGGEWVRPYAQAPGTWELVGRLFPDLPELRRDRAFRGFLDVSILAAGSINARTKPDSTMATFVRFLPVQDNNVLNAGQPPDRVNVAEVLQVQYLARDGASLRLETRIGNPSSEFQRCYDARHTQFAHLADIRVQAALMCDGALFWLSWRGQPPLVPGPDGKANLLLDELGTLVVTLDAKTSELSAEIHTPPPGGGSGPRPR